MAQGRYNVLFLPNRNTARSIFAEAVTNRIAARISKASVPGCIRPESSIRSLRMSCAWRAIPPKVCIQNPGRISREPSTSARFRFHPVRSGCRRAGAALARPARYCRLALCRSGKTECEDWERRKELGAMLAGRERQLRAFIQLAFRSLDDISLRERLRELGRGVEAS
jgi:hypothetical protein